MHSSEQSDGTCYLLRMPLGECHAPKLFDFRKSTDHRKIELREAIYLQVLDRRWAPFGEWKLDGMPTPLEYSNEESRDNDSFAEDQRGMDDILARTNAESYSHQGISSIEQTGKRASEADRKTDSEEVSIEEVKAWKREGGGEETVEVLDKEMESQKNGHILAPQDTTDGRLREGFSWLF